MLVIVSIKPDNAIDGVAAYPSIDPGTVTLNALFMDNDGRVKGTFEMTVPFDVMKEAIAKNNLDDNGDDNLVFLVQSDD